MIRKTPIKKKTKFVVSRWAEKYGLLRTMKSISREKYAEKISASILYGILYAIAVSFFFQPGHVYSSGATGFGQVLSAIGERLVGFNIAITLAFYEIYLHLMIFDWFRFGNK